MRDIPIDRIMTPDPATIGPNDTAARARRLLESNVIHHLPVVEGERLVRGGRARRLARRHLLLPVLRRQKVTPFFEHLQHQLFGLQRRPHQLETFYRYHETLQYYDGCRLALYL